MNRVVLKYWYIITQCIYKRKFKTIGKGSVVYKPLQFNSVHSISLGSNVYIAEGSWLIGNDEKDITLTIADGTTIGHFVHIVARESVEIQEKVLIADKVFITDSSHGYEDISKPVLEQDNILLRTVTIGEGSWLGDNVSVCGANIGKHCVIGANSVVVKDIPDYCVAVGNPARVIKKYNFESQKWEPCKSQTH